MKVSMEKVLDWKLKNWAVKVGFLSRDSKAGGLIQAGAWNRWFRHCHCGDKPQIGLGFGTLLTAFYILSSFFPCFVGMIPVLIFFIT